MSNPYKSLPPRNFWRSAVSEVNPLHFEGIYTKKYEIARTDVVATAGSCFAQHIGRALTRNGFAFKDFEPAPPFMTEEARQRFGYGIYSARYGNIYTARQLLQTFLRAFGKYQPKQQVVEKEGRWFDLLRPAIEPQGFASEQECINSIRSHMAAVRKMFEEASVFVFTLGLTEAWESTVDGLVYPVCPGTVAGEFNADTHVFHNFTFAEIFADMRDFLELLREVNPAVRVLLTVSPVPLTATASSDHVLVASMYSKSVLRAVAGELSKSMAYVDYYPSYELVASHPMRSMFFDPNLRTVASQGVEIVLSHFFKEHTPAVADLEVDRLERRKARKARNALRRSRKLDKDDVVCEEMLLDQAL